MGAILEYARRHAEIRSNRGHSALDTSSTRRTLFLEIGHLTANNVRRARSDYFHSAVGLGLVAAYATN